jgi:hypothetical protein
LKRLLGKPCYAVVGLLESLWLLTISSADEGDVGRFSNEEIADAIEWDGDADALIDALITAGWLDRDDERRLVVHDWLDHCPKYIKDRLRQRRHRSPSPTARDEQADERPLSPPPCDTEREPRPKSPLTQPNPTQPIPTTPTMRRDPVAVAVDELLKAGISNATPTVETAIDNGLDVEGIRAVIRYWQTRTDLQGGALVKRLTLADAARLAPAAGWPSPPSTAKPAAELDYVARRDEIKARPPDAIRELAEIGAERFDCRGLLNRLREYRWQPGDREAKELMDLEDKLAKETVAA